MKGEGREGGGLEGGEGQGAREGEGRSEGEGSPESNFEHILEISARKGMNPSPDVRDLLETSS